MTAENLSIKTGDLDDGLEISFQAGQGFLGDSNLATFVCVGDLIEEENTAELLKGHGIQSIDGKLFSTVCGRVERIDKLVSVRPLKSRYTAEVGEVVIGRVMGILTGQWKVDINGRQEALMGLTSVYLPGQVHRRRTEEDESNMRSVFREGDLLVAEVQTVRHDGGTNLHTRSEKYGKLMNGRLVTISASLVQRQRQHFHTIDDLGALIIFGCNGYIWIGPNLVEGHPLGEKECLESLARLTSAVKVLARLCLLVYLDSVLSVFHLSVETGCQIQDMKSSDFLHIVAENEFLKRQK